MEKKGKIMITHLDIKNQISNEEWVGIREKIGLSYCFRIDNCDNFFEKYFLEMERLINEIKNNPYESEEDESKLKEDLYELDGMFILYDRNMTKYFHYINERFQLYDAGQILEYPHVNVSFPYSHNFNKYLNWGNYFSPVLFENYYLKIVDAIDGFVKSRGTKIPKYLYNLRESKDSFFIETYEYFNWKDIPHERGAHLSLPRYHQISGPNGTLEDYELLYRKWFPKDKDFKQCFSRFLESEWPIRQWITNNRPEVSHEIIHKKDCIKIWENERYMEDMNREE